MTLDARCVVIVGYWVFAVIWSGLLASKAWDIHKVMAIIDVDSPACGLAFSSLLVTGTPRRGWWSSFTSCISVVLILVLMLAGLVFFFIWLIKRIWEAV